ncbi:MAG TPA: pitrilysin family protein [Methylomirabilota bacterium]|nr:pitrilysin family protein [Methylomirabilota bacterium]
MSILVAPLVGLACVSAGAQEVVEATLDNGLRVLLQEDHRSPVASLQVWYRVGSRDERVGLTGLSHYLEHMMFKGTPTYGVRVYSKLIETVGGQDNAFTSRDATVYHVTVAANQLDLVLALEADRMRHLLLDSREVDSERKVVMEERRTRTEDDPVGALAELFNAVAFTAHPYRLPTVGFAQDIERLAAGDLRSWYDTYYRPNNAILVAVGDFRTAELLEKIRARFGAIPRGPDPPRVAVTEPEQRGERRVWLRKEAQLPVVFAGYSAPNHRSEDAYALEVLSAVLSGGRTSRLYRRLVYEDRLALEAGGDYARLSLDPDTFTFYVTVLPGRTVEEAERALLAEVERLRTDLVSVEELQRAQNQLEAAYLFAQDSVVSRSGSLGRHELLGGWRLRDAYLAGIRAITRDDVRRVAERYLVADRRTTAILVPVPAAAARP